ncbi:UNVERIFIED_CONTAM: hypothetical protein Slati_0433800 [Sesamum latifolium]|uniref:Retrotransposon Copia-like N-terminal domain-containing protein n=1 Tax=Sesamum latifolium TaxID=2727402 RepID=A0AAW2Y021_9LAMI
MATEVAAMDVEGAGANDAPQKRDLGVLQLHNSDHPGMVLVCTPLDGKNFFAWSRAIRCALEAKSKLGFITARVLWITLNERYGICNGPLLYQLEHEMASAMQGDLSVVNYFIKLQMLWDELVQLRPLPKCTCGSACTCNVAKATTDLIEERHLMQFLMGLNDEYDNVRSQILVMEPLPNINRAYQMVLRVVRQQVHTNLKIHAKEQLCHDKSTCFKIHGVPNWYKELNEQRKKNYGGNNAVHAVQGLDTQKEGVKDDRASVTDVVMELMKALKRLPNDPIHVNHAEDYAVGKRLLDYRFWSNKSHVQ